MIIEDLCGGLSGRCLTHLPHLARGSPGGGVRRLCWPHEPVYDQCRPDDVLELARHSDFVQRAYDTGTARLVVMPQDHAAGG